MATGHLLFVKGLCSKLQTTEIVIFNMDVIGSASSTERRLNVFLPLISPDTAPRLALKASEVLSIESSNSLPGHSNRISDCKHVVLRWLAGKLDPSHAKEVLRGLSNCNVNKGEHVLKSCGNIISNKEECCNSMESYISHLQKQSLITNLQALDCATTLGMKLQKSNITMDVYSLCHITLIDFSLQVAKEGAFLTLNIIFCSVHCNQTHFCPQDEDNFLCPVHRNQTSHCLQFLFCPILPYPVLSCHCVYYFYINFLCWIF
ncbi:hypothetical protein K2173_016301 [Erythroxylum novogranatense]|uniref:At1g61900-like C-terminal domain-containing protein n=1 Tax=Erythroxylum novogranatense TaxID=1862640 RepID=A0AAV8SG03_9ROSI|nr:hypothetical protein K2173_016301 [Erythroxylum novogranatense]